MKRWPKMFGARIVAAVLSCSLACVALSQTTFAKALEQARVARNLEDLDAIEEQLAAQDAIDDSLGYFFDSDVADATELTPEIRNRLVKMLELRVRAESAQTADPASTKTDAQEIKKSNRLYADPGAKESSNWIGKAFERIGNLFQSDDDENPRSSRRTVPATGGGIGNLLIYTFIGILSAGLIVLIVLALRHAQWKSGKKRKAKALLEDDEPERTLDEWLQMADDLTAQGRYREAVRCLYLAMLLKFDEHSIARFERGETNWEHLARIRKSPKLPTSMDFEPPTRRFDLVWYGFKGDGIQDVERFKAWYLEVKATLEGAKAA